MPEFVPFRPKITQELWSNLQGIYRKMFEAENWYITSLPSEKSPAPPADRVAELAGYVLVCDKLP
jgi:hypothetical protein